MKHLFGFQKAARQTLVLTLPLTILLQGCSGAVQFKSGPVSAAAFTPNTGLITPQGFNIQYAVAFEDRFPNAGDEDFNDFLTNFHYTEFTNSSNQITRIVIDFYPRAVGASYDHQFLLVLKGVKDAPTNLTLQTPPLFNGEANVTVSHLTAGGAVIDSQSGLSPDHDLVVFPSTHGAFSSVITNQVIDTTAGVSYTTPLMMARVDITLTNPELNPLPAAPALDYARMRMILHVKDTNEDVDTVNADPNNIDSKGYPYGFVIPTAWQWATEGTLIDSIYPEFTSYRQYLSNRAANPTTSADPTTLNWFMSPLSSSSNLYPLVPTQSLIPIQ